VLQTANGDRHIVQHTEALAVIGKGMMRTAREIAAAAVGERGLRSQPRSLHGKPGATQQPR